MLSQKRIGNFTSSNIWKLTTTARDKKNFGAKALEYIREVNFERKIQRSLSTEIDAKPLQWGKCLEKVAFDTLGIEYKLCSNDTIEHPEHKFWMGTPDATKPKTVADLKCPYTLKSYCAAMVSNNPDVFREEHNDGEKYYWQIVSNAILTKSKFGEIIFYMPYYRELEKIKQRSVDIEFNKMKNEFAWIFHAPEEELPFLPDGCGIKNIHKIEFEVPKADIEFLTERVVRAGGLLHE